jgi:hypothetical protein
MLLRKIIFVPLLLLLISTLCFLYTSVLNNYLEIFFKPYGGLIELGTIALTILLSGLTFIIYLTLTQDFKFALVAGFITSLAPFAFLESSLALVIAVGFFISFILAYFNLQTNLKTYVNFAAAPLLTPPIKLLNTFILLTLAFGYFLHTNSVIQTQGFRVPDQLIEWAVDLSLKGQNPAVLGKKYLAQLPTLTEEQLNLLKQNPQILEQYGMTADDLEQFTPSSTSTPSSPNKNAVSITPSVPGANLKDIIKAQISNSLDDLLKPYLFAIPAVLALMFYSLTSFTLWLISLLLSPLISLIFSIFEKSGFLKFTSETRVVKKIIT